MIVVEELTAERGKNVVLDKVSFSVDTGEWVLITGPNGSGKTTLIEHLNGLQTSDSGTVTVNGTSVEEDLVAVRTSIGMVFQNPADMFVASTVGADVAFGPENLGLPKEEINQRVDQALDAVGMLDQKQSRVEGLSGGEMARVAIAGALAMRPDYLVLDEPFVGLDLAARDSILSRLDDLVASGTGVIIVTHDLRHLIDRVDRIIGLANGEIVADGSPDEVAEVIQGIDVWFPQ